MGDDDEDRLLLPVQIEQERSDVFRRLAIKVAGRLIAENEERFPDQRSRNRYTLLLTAGQLGRTMIQPFG